ncbi:Mycobacterium rhizamassiliense ORFan [Mycobacterium rhizamassiliense]|jgi:hypothetical protein|uniref:Mycobacterium rhizamassiliense ORFan n=1 Tax=Mycobacterium rhizamassiliense TaxID=1841860 RepID=A0A2U3NYR6_9MYCO|nr:hypothetical protein [Mycobacterium rhizamassiliense]SPM36637.1 Mycobacterium rhizamassiliense ORFan [Mycobacterium rhizamassiliense]
MTRLTSKIAAIALVVATNLVLSGSCGVPVTITCPDPYSCVGA